MKRYCFITAVISALVICTKCNDTVGLFAVHGEKYEQMDKIMYRKIKGSGGLGAALSMGLAKVKAKWSLAKQRAITSLMALRILGFILAIRQ